MQVVYRSIYGPTTIIPHTVVQLDRSSCPTVGEYAIVVLPDPQIILREIHEIFEPQKFGAVRYIYIILYCHLLCH